MISFEGKISKEAFSFARKKIIRVMSPISIIFFLVGIILFTVDYHYEVFRFAFALSFLLVTPILLLAPLFAPELVVVPQKVEIEDGIIECYFEKEPTKMKNVDQVKRVTDRGNFYEIVFYFPPGMVACICQKDLLIEGTIEEFEDVFQDKLVRKLK